MKKPYIKRCEACKSLGEPFIGHNVRNCQNILPSDRESILKTFNLEVDEHRDAINEYESESRMETFRESTDYNKYPIEIERV